MFQTLYVLAGIFLAICLAFWIVGLVFHAAWMLVMFAIKILIPLAIIIFIVGFIRSRA